MIGVQMRSWVKLQVQVRACVRLFLGLNATSVPTVDTSTATGTHMSAIVKESVRASFCAGLAVDVREFASMRSASRDTKYTSTVVRTSSSEILNESVRRTTCAGMKAIECLFNYIGGGARVLVCVRACAYVLVRGRTGGHVRTRARVSAERLWTKVLVSMRVWLRTSAVKPRMDASFPSPQMQNSITTNMYCALLSKGAVTPHTLPAMP